ncbi:hypothetical protein PoB_003874800 [Plakobranchus ocellatus]|uniref:Uncharacterized protein n=1 Tax=Plakobranchus ocellatus TaxID=259542 RepID=A0AAV4AZE2_9GAST|nr:hypothetical protein PoB_003874800 [Plakobranchus ocellatus]
MHAGKKKLSFSENLIQIYWQDLLVVCAGHPSSPEEALSTAKKGEACDYGLQTLAAQPHCAAAATSHNSDDVVVLRRELQQLSDQVRSLVISTPRPQRHKKKAMSPESADHPKLGGMTQPIADVRPCSANSAIDWVTVPGQVGRGL